MAVPESGWVCRLATFAFSFSRWENSVILIPITMESVNTISEAVPIWIEELRL